MDKTISSHTQKARFTNHNYPGLSSNFCRKPLTNSDQEKKTPGGALRKKIPLTLEDEPSGTDIHQQSDPAHQNDDGGTTVAQKR
jgi:hypothetical protein